MTIQPTAVYAPGSSPAQMPPPGSRPGGGYSGGQYWVYQNGPSGNLPPTPNRSIYNRLQALPQQPARANVNIPPRLPGFLKGTMTNRSIVFNAWIIAMILIGFDEWHNLGILPRPARLWDATLVYGILIMVGFVDQLVPIANALAVGYTFMLLFEYFQGNITPLTAEQQAQQTRQSVGYQGVATVPGGANPNGANPTGSSNG